MGSSRARRYLLRFALAAAALLVALVAAELCYRALFAADNGPTTNPQYVDHDDLRGWRYRPNVVTRHRTDEFDVAIRIDAGGWRTGRAAPPRTGPRVVCLGDSFTFGWGVEEERSFPALLRELLAADVANLGVSGYGPGQQLITLRQAGLEPPPALAIVTYCGNDLFEVLHDRAHGKTKPRFVLDGDALRLTNVPVPWGPLERHSQLWRAARKVLAGAAGPLDAADADAARRLTRRIHAEMADALRVVGGRLLVVAVGEPWLAPDAPNASYLDVAPALETARSGGPVTFAKDGHWYDCFHCAFAEAIAGQVDFARLLR